MTSAGHEPVTIHIRARCATYYAMGEDDTNGYCKLNMNCSPFLPPCKKVILVFSKCICAGFGSFSTSKYRVNGGASKNCQFMTTVGYEEIQSFVTYGSYYS